MITLFKISLSNHLKGNLGSEAEYLVAVIALGFDYGAVKKYYF